MSEGNLTSNGRVGDRPKCIGDPIRPVWTYKDMTRLYPGEAWRLYAMDLEIERERLNVLVAGQTLEIAEVRTTPEPRVGGTGQTITATHDETGRWWRGPRGALPKGYTECPTQPPPADDMRAALVHAVEVIQTWHNMDVPEKERSGLWDIYWRNAPEMKPIRAALTKNGIHTVNTGDGRGWDREGAPAPDASGETRPSELCAKCHRARPCDCQLAGGSFAPETSEPPAQFFIDNEGVIDFGTPPGED